MSKLSREHLKHLGLLERESPDVYLDADEVLGTPHAAAMRLAFNTLGVDGFLCIQGAPTVAFLVQDERNVGHLNYVHRALWNQGLASLLLVLFPGEIAAYSLTQKPVSEDWRPPDHASDPRLAQTLTLTATGLEAFNLITSVESGRFFVEHSDRFDRSSRVDKVLLSNLVETQNRLMSTRLDRGLTAQTAVAQAQALLLQIMFVSFLEDRDLITGDVFEEAGSSGKRCLLELLASDSPQPLLQLFLTLRYRFNGDLFLAPCSFDGSSGDSALLVEDLVYLAEFRRGLVELDTGQGRFWPYDFRYIPIDLISAVYDRFLGSDNQHKRGAGAYYTPRALADFSVAQAWDFLRSQTLLADDTRILDPACGSGIFLVRMFQALVEQHRQETGLRHPSWNVLLGILQRLSGWDVEANAVRIAVFSLCVALLEEAEPKTVRRRLQKGKLMPRLFGATLCARDFFAEDESSHTFDVIIGNPPWVSRRRERTATARKWCQTRNLPLPEGELAWGFVWRALELIKPAGLISFLLPAMGILLNRKPTTVEARQTWLSRARILRVINLSDLRFQLFEGAVRPTALCLFARPDGEGSNYRFQYWVPKADPHLAATGTITVASIDCSEFSSAEASSEPDIWKQRMWARSPEAKILRWLAALQPLGDLLATSREGNAQGKPWQIGQGFQPATRAELADPDFRPRECQFDATLPHLTGRAFQRWVLPKQELRPFGTRPLRRCGFEKGFSGPHVLISQGALSSSGRLQVAYIEESLTFLDSLQAIHFPVSDAPKLKLLTALLNSGFAAWYFFHSASNPGAERAKVHESELLSFPFVPVEELNEEKQRRAAEEILCLMDDLLLSRDPLFLQSKLLQAEQRIDRLVYAYYGFTDGEISVVEDGLSYVLPSAQPHRGKAPILWRASTDSDWQNYYLTLSRALGGWFEGEEIVTGHLAGYNKDLAVLRLGFKKEPSGKPFTITSNPGKLRAVLDRLNETLPRAFSANLQLIPDLRVFIDDELYLVKPRPVRHWLLSTALDDADAIAAHLLETDRTSDKASR